VAVAAALWTVRRPAMRAGMTVAPRDAISGAVGIVLGLPIMLSVGVLMFAAASFLSRVSDAPPPDEAAHGTLRQILDLHAESGLSWWALPIAFQVVVLAPILEEVLYRGCLQSALAHLRIGPRTRIVAASAVFASIHISAVPWHAMPTLFAVGAICGYAFERTGRLGAPILIHAAFNALNLGMALAAAG
ncbi:MAG: lysostaphin resistance A-like protein, partial [Phycisphaerales bacterium]